MTERNGVNRRSLLPFVAVGLVVALVTGMVVSNFSASTPDALQRAVINSACADRMNEAAKEACLAEQEGEPLLAIQPSATSDYGISWFSGLVGVAATFLVVAGLLYFLRGKNSSGSNSVGSRVR